MLVVEYASIVCLIILLGCLTFSSSSTAKIDFLKLQCDPRTDLISLKKQLDQGFSEEKQSYCKSLSNKYNQVSRWIKQKESTENPEMIDKDEIGQTLILEDIVLADETSGFLACKATGDGDCLFHSGSPILVGDQSLSHFLPTVNHLELYIAISTLSTPLFKSI